MKTTQCKRILEYMKIHGSINPKEAEKVFGCMRLSARIKDLREQGYDIKTARKSGISRDGTVCIYAEYHLIKEENNA